VCYSTRKGEKKRSLAFSMSTSIKGEKRKRWGLRNFNPRGKREKKETAQITMAQRRKKKRDTSTIPMGKSEKKDSSNYVHGKEERGGGLPFNIEERGMGERKT